MKVVCCGFVHILSVGFLIVSVAESNVSRISWSFLTMQVVTGTPLIYHFRYDKEMCCL